MAKKMKKLLSLILALSMIMSLMSVVASAEGAPAPLCEYDYEHTHTEACYEVDSTKCSKHVHGAKCYTGEELTCGLAVGQDLDCSIVEHIHVGDCNHTHSEVCQPLNCSEDHEEHTTDCYVVCEKTMDCTEDAHSHSESCNHKDHVHSTSCMKLVCEFAEVAEHRHDAACYTITGNITEDTVWDGTYLIGNVNIKNDVTITVSGTVTVVGTIRMGTDAICNVTFNGENDAMLIRGNDFQGQMFYAEGVSGSFQNLIFNNITLDGGAVWTGDVNKTLERGTTNSGVKANGSVLYLVYANAVLDNSILQNHDDSTGEKANAVFLRYYSTIEFNDSVVKNINSKSTYYRGGVVTIRQGGTVKTNNTEVYGNSSPAGGFVGISSTGSFGGIVEAYNSKFHNNYSDNGAVFLMQCNSKIGYLLIDGCKFYENGSSTQYASLLGEWAYSRPMIIKDSYFHDNECPVWNCHTDPVLDLSGNIVVEEDEDYTNFLFETPIGVGGALTADSVFPLSDASYTKLMTGKKHLMTEVPTDNYYNPTSKYTIAASDMATLVWNDPNNPVLVKTDVDGNGMLDVVPVPTGTTTDVNLYENYKMGTEKESNRLEVQAVSNEAKNVPIAVWFREGFYFDGWATEANGARVYYNANTAATYADKTNLYATWKLQTPELSLSRKSSDYPDWNTLQVSVNNKNLDGEIAYTYQWYKDGVAIDGATSDEYTITETADYKCVVTAAAEGFASVSAEKGGNATYNKLYVAEIVGGEKYESIAAAVKAASAGDTVKVLKDHTITYTGKYPIYFQKNVTLDLNGKEIQFAENANADAVFLINECEVTITGNGKVIVKGTSATDRDFAPYVFWSYGENGKLTIENGTFTLDCTESTKNHFMFYTNFGGDVIVKGGFFEMTGRDDLFNMLDSDPGAIVLYGGTYDEDPRLDNQQEVTIPEGYTVIDNQNGTWTVVMDAVAEIVGGEKYPSIAAAVKAAKTGDTIKVLKDHEMDVSELTQKSVVFVDGTKIENLIIDFNGKTVTANTGDNTSGNVWTIFYARYGAEVTFTGDGNVNIVGDDANRPYLFWASASTITVEDGTYIMDGSTTQGAKNGAVSHTFYASSGGHIYVEDGYYGNIDSVIDLMNIYDGSGSTITVTGGTYTEYFPDTNQPWEVTVPEGYAIVDNGNGTWTVNPKVTVTFADQTMEVGSDIPTLSYNIDYGYIGEGVVNVNVTNISVKPAASVFALRSNSLSSADLQVGGDYIITGTVTLTDGTGNAEDYAVEAIPGVLTVAVASGSGETGSNDGGNGGFIPGGNGSGSGTGTGSDIDEIPDEEVALDPAPEQEEIPDEEVALDPAPELEEIPDEKVPLANVPKTGDMTALWAAASVVSAAGVLFLGKKRKDEE